ncbi:MAG: signal peptidase I, partial [Actinobacteria bacterium]|nr:signal peptidase I [Actinomycetota bacterium]
SSRGIRVVDSTEYVLAPRERVIAKRNPVKSALQISTKVAGWLVVSILLLFTCANVAGLVDSRVVLTGSMIPSINPGDLVISASPTRLMPDIGDVVIYTGKKFDGTTVASFAHRIIGGNAVSGFEVKGDNNPNPDVQKPVLSEIEGVVFLTIPLVGKLLSPQVFILLLLCGFGIWLIVDAFRDEE